MDFSWITYILGGYSHYGLGWTLYSPLSYLSSGCICLISLMAEFIINNGLG